jgi:hypothetical protein
MDGWLQLPGSYAIMRGNNQRLQSAVLHGGLGELNAVLTYDVLNLW